jgi:PAN domain
MRLLLTLCGALALAALMLAGPARAQTGFDRPGGDYTTFTIRSGDPAVCSTRCERDARCMAWAFSFPRSENVHAACWLKNKVTPRTEDRCCVSGVRGAGVIEPRLGPTEFAIDRNGGDYRNFETPSDSTGSACKAACEIDSKCRAWTYARPGYEGSSARCYLKDKLTRPRPQPCCVSSVVR